MPTQYKIQPPDPIEKWGEFNVYLRTHNEVIKDNANWILIENSYIPGELVLWSVWPYTDIADLSPQSLLSLPEMLEPYRDNYKYINANKDKSVPNRLHIHIKLDEEKNKHKG